MECGFCKEEVVIMSGQTPESRCVHHINGNHTDTRPENEMDGHIRCHQSYHNKGIPKTVSHRRKISEALRGRTFTDEHKQHLRKLKKHNTNVNRILECIQSGKNTPSQLQSWTGWRKERMELVLDVLINERKLQKITVFTKTKPGTKYVVIA